MTRKTDIEDLQDIKFLVDSFYNRIRRDDLLSGIFNGIIKDSWPKHLDKMYRFWQTVLLSDYTYYGSPFAPHSKMPVTKAHFDRWIEVFTSTVDELFAGPRADEAKWRAEKMAQMFQMKIEHYQNRRAEPLL